MLLRPSTSSTTTSKLVLRSLYRSLLRAARPFSHPSPSAPAYASLIRRSGVAHDWEECVHKLENNRQRVAATTHCGDKHNDGKIEKQNILPRSWARNLSRSYSDLQEDYALRKDYFEQRYGVDDDDDDWDEDDETAMDLAVGSSSYYKHNDEYIMEEDPKFILFRHLLREWFAGDSRRDDYGIGEKKSISEERWPRQWSPKELGYYENGKVNQIPLMKFPSQITCDNASLSLKKLIQREFRAPTVEERMMMESSKAKEKSSNPEAFNSGRPRHAPRRETSNDEIYPSSFIDNEIRIQTAFYTLTELNRKLAWATKIGLSPDLFSQEAKVNERKRKRLAQAAKGVSQFSSDPPTIETNTAFLKEESSSLEAHNKDGNNADNDDDDANKIPSSTLQCGTYLIAHPLMTGYFAKSVIVILDHAEEVNNSTKTEEGSGGTYGLIINRLALQPAMVQQLPQRLQWDILRQNWEEEKRKSEMKEEEHHPAVGASRNDALESSSSNSRKTGSSDEPTTVLSSPDTTARSAILRRPISLLQAMQDLPETVQMAFGDSPVREGGPVNLSLQMIHRRAVEKTIASADQDSDPNTQEGEMIKQGKVVSSKIGGTPLLGAEQHENKQKDSEERIYFRGDVIEASYEVLNGRSDREDFSFIIGAACWAPGQLANEIDQGCWMPFRGPPQMTMTGMVDHIEDIAAPASSDSDEHTETGGTTPFPPKQLPNTAIFASQQPSCQPAMRPVGDLWLSIMCALGEDEADVGFMMLDNKNVTDKLGDACDNFDR